MGRPRKIQPETPEINPIETTPSEQTTPVEEALPDTSGEVCENCGKPLTAFVVGDGKKFCADTCLNEYLSKK
jgi:hypothetical protein